MQKTEELNAQIHSFRYHLSLYTENIQELFLKHQEVLSNLFEADVDLAIEEVYLWCKSLQDRILLVQFSCKYFQNDFTNQLVKEAILLGANFYDCVYILKANTRNQFLSLQQMESLYNEAEHWAEYTWEYIELIHLEQKNPLLIYDIDKGIAQAEEMASSCNDFICMGEYFARINKDKSCFWYEKAMQAVENDDDRKDLLKSVNRHCINDEFKKEVYEQFFEQTEDKSFRLKLFHLLKSNYWKEEKANEKWSAFCFEILQVQNWQFLNQICDKSYRKGGKKLRKLIEKAVLLAPSEPLDLLPYARFMKMLYCNKSKAKEYIVLAEQIQEDKDTLEPLPFLTIAQMAWKEVKDQALTHQLLEAAYVRVEGIDEYCLLLETLRETSGNRELMKRFFYKCLQKKYPSYEYYRIAKMAIYYLEDKELANKAISIALQNADSYFKAMLIRTTIEEHELADNQLKESAILMKRHISNTEEAIDMAQIIQESFDCDELESILEIGKNLAETTEDFSIMIKFVNFWLSNPKRAHYYLQIAINNASNSTDFERLVVDARLLFGVKWRRAF